MTYSLLSCSKIASYIVDGYWIQDCVACTLEDAIERAISTKKANSNKIEIAVIPAVNSTTPILDYFKNQKAFYITSKGS